MTHFACNLKKFRIAKHLTQEELATLLHLTPQSVSKWERGETYPDITLLPALANIFETSIDLLMGMDEIRAEETVRQIHASANTSMRKERLADAETIYRNALLLYPNDPGMLLGLASVLALKGDANEAVTLILQGLPLSANEKQKATLRATLCFLYQKLGQNCEAVRLAKALPHTRESREAILPVLCENLSAEALEYHIRLLILGEEKAELC